MYDLWNWLPTHSCNQIRHSNLDTPADHHIDLIREHIFLWHSQTDPLSKSLSASINKDCSYPRQLTLALMI